jgi:hypothetical protein
VEPAPDPHPAPLTAVLGPTMAEILEKYGATWQIEIAEPASFIAVRRPTPTAQDVLVAHSLAELDRKLAAESGPERTGPHEH